MNKLLISAGLTALVATAIVAETGAALARGGGANIMNSPGYQRRLQESRGYVTNQSGSIVAPPPSVEPPRPKIRRRR